MARKVTHAIPTIQIHKDGHSCKVNKAELDKWVERGWSQEKNKPKPKPKAQTTPAANPGQAEAFSGEKKGQ